MFFKDIDYSKLFSGNYVKISAYVNKRNFNDIREIYFEDSEEIFFNFHELNKSIWKIIKELSLKRKDFTDKEPYYYYDNNIYKKFLLEVLLFDWNIDVEIEKDSRGYNKNIEQILMIHPSLLEYFTIKFDEYSFMEDTYKEVLCDQCLILFNKHSNGLRNAEPIIAEYLEYVSFWEKFGLNFYDIEKLPNDVYEGLKLILSKENEIKSKELEEESRNTKQSGNANSISFNF